MLLFICKTLNIVNIQDLIKHHVIYVSNSFQIRLVTFSLGL
jgi:hypothetical protein